MDGKSIGETFQKLKAKRDFCSLGWLDQLLEVAFSRALRGGQDLKNQRLAEPSRRCQKGTISESWETEKEPCNLAASLRSSDTQHISC